MSMNKNEFRNCIDDAVQADPYLQPRLAEKVLAQRPKRKTRVLIPVLSAVLCVAVLAFCLTRYTGLGLNSRTGRSHKCLDEDLRVRDVKTMDETIEAAGARVS